MPENTTLFQLPVRQFYLTVHKYVRKKAQLVMRTRKNIKASKSSSIINLVIQNLF